MWGEIQQNAIISVVNVADLLSRPPSTPDDKDIFAFHFIQNAWSGYFVRHELYEKKTPLSYSTGFALGQFLKMLKLPELYHESAITTIIRDFGFRIRKDDLWQEDQVFCKGIQYGLKSDLPKKRELQPISGTSVAQKKQISNSTQTKSEQKAAPIKPRVPSPHSDSTSTSVTVQTEPGDTFSDVIMTDDRDHAIQRTETQQQAIFADLPQAYELECVMCGYTNTSEHIGIGSHGALASSTVSLEIEILMKIQDKL